MGLKHMALTWRTFTTKKHVITLQAGIQSQVGKNFSSPFKKQGFTYAFLFLTCLFVPLTLAAARDKNLPIPRFATIRPERANIRVGPGPGYPIEWVVLKSGVPVEITAEFDNWCRISFVDESQGWIHRNMLSGKRTVWVVSADASLHASSKEESSALARVEKGALADLQKCDGPWCQIKIQGFKGWVKRTDVWGVYATEKVN